MKNKFEITLAIITVIVVACGSMFIYFINKYEQTKLIEKLNVYVDDKMEGQTVLGTYTWNNSLNNILKKNYTISSPPANILLEDAMEIIVKKDSKIRLEVDKDMYNISNYKLKNEIEIVYTDDSGNIIKDEKLNIKEKIEFKVPDAIKNKSYVTVITSYEEKGTIYNYFKIKMDN